MACSHDILMSSVFWFMMGGVVEANGFDKVIAVFMVIGMTLTVVFLHDEVGI
jgi:hypothetical protein